MTDKTRAPQYRQAPPFAVQVELTEGCNLACSFCGIHGIRAKPGDYKYLSVQVAYELAKNLSLAIEYDGWNPRIEFAMHGEPTANPEWLTILATFRAALPNQPLMLTTNGSGLLKAPGPNYWIEEAIGYVDTIAIDAYDRYKLHERIAAAYHQPIPWYPDDRSLNPHRRPKKGEKRVMFVRDISVTKDGTHAKLFNHAGCAAPPSDELAGHRCAKPFRELSIRWDGRVAVCCDDWRGVMPIGSLLATPAEGLWQHPRFQAMRRRLYEGKRDIGPCLGCTHRSYRVGLLPDPTGTQDMPPARSNDLIILAKAMAEGPLTVPVARPWESRQVAPGVAP